ncbi:type IX secretion system membrane protein PorP/SprF [Arenibacter algicola]|uniref:PorP/SprF family type IX secretion system membrane protein n=1 Tax=Arenibacter algicola TaxID=616991 RepID=UPI001C06BDD7|nr:type IX secretion system membrane protein PorP/SprF [Arenibacter algicola]MBU2907326.1 type IX secretion system membrane protein PorP/SprF [Arenibacter algicola]
MKLRFNKIYIFLALFFVLGNMTAQQDPNYTFYRYTMNIVNPAFAGAEHRTEFMANVRSQWAGVEGAPETQSFIASTHLGKKVGLGASVVNDKTFIETQTSIAVDFSYLVRWNDYTNIYLGIKASGNSYNANTDGLTTFGIGSDPSLMDIDGGITPNVGAGIYVKSRKFSLAFSAPKILKPKRLEEDEGTAKLGRNKMHMYLMGAYDFEIARNLLFKPSTMIRHIESAPLSVDLTLALKYNNIFEFGPSYRLDEGFAGFVLFSPTDSLHIGYAYEAALNSSLNNTNNGTHEILLKVSL